HEAGTELNLLGIFSSVGGNVGVAGLLSMLPLHAEIRPIWLAALCTITKSAQRSDHPLNPTTLDAVWKIAVSESAPTVVVCPGALFLLAATGRPESLHILWTHANLGDVERRRAALYAIAQLDPGDALNELLNGLADLPLVLPAPRRPYGQQNAAEPAELT